MNKPTKPFALDINNGRYVVLFAQDKNQAVGRFDMEYRRDPNEKVTNVREVT